ncbi:TetR/AcrR family transcriptional regulator [Nonomuraea sediminis]|uniref:TetR/AcrR family transcriptional regulator n=1 Tax=Nonomuraea sediminis TaxID=2835864 RepID=UPI001BDC37BF|nr:TetR/AcrR family transcriptional regulator [Nonomuraea sediminis]
MPSLRDRRKAETYRSIQEHALRLFAERGFDQTTVGDVAEAAGVSSMTVFRHFPTKEDLVLADEYDPVLAERIAAGPAGEPLIRRVAAVLADGLAATSPGERELMLARLRIGLTASALRARRWENHHRTTEAVVAALPAEDPLEVRVAVGACLAAVTTALTHWAEHGGDPHELAVRALNLVLQQKG